MKNLHDHLALLYGEDQAPGLVQRAQKLIEDYQRRIPIRNSELSERDSLLITYGDQVQAPNEKPLKTLNTFCSRHLADIVRGIHILPFYPWTSDDGFSVVDYRQVDPNLGTWEEVSALQDRFGLMFDGVINHISAESAWFKGFLQDDPRYRDYFVTVTGKPDLSQVVRPRTLPLLTLFSTPSGQKQVWTTFSADQIDLNYKNPEVLFEILDVLFMYMQHGATFIRLDAIAYMWKEIGTKCIHQPQTHEIIKFLHTALNEAPSQVHLITETNVPHVDNISYFGDGTDEAQLVYNFALPPLTLHAFHTGNAQTLSKWAKTLKLPSNTITFFNFLASHDGIGLNPARGILSEREIDALVYKVVEHSGLVSHKNNPDGSQSPYEMNINYFDALSNPNGSEPLDLQIDRFMAAQAIMLALLGMPGIYFHSLFGSRGWQEGVKLTGRNRTINREKCRMDRLESELADENSLRARVFSRYCALLSARGGYAAFHPHGEQVILDVHPSVFALERISQDAKSHVVCFHNVSAQALTFKTEYGSGTNLLNAQPFKGNEITLQAYQTLWIKL